MYWKNRFWERLIVSREIAYFYILQVRCRTEDDYDGHWQLTQRVSVTSKTTKMARDKFMQSFKNPGRRCEWTQRIDELAVPGAVITLELEETFDIVLKSGFLLALISLGTALAYGFAMNNDFATGIVALVAVNEYFARTLGVA